MVPKKTRSTASSHQLGSITSVASYLELFFSLKKKHEGAARCVRGHSMATWIATPTIMRDRYKRDSESRVLSELLLETPSEFTADTSMFEKLVRARHYGLPTRIMDVSLNPLVGLFFACEMHDSESGLVQVFDFSAERVKFSDSDAVSLISNLSRLSDGERDELRESAKDMADRTDSTALEAFRQGTAMKRLIQFVRVEKPYFLDLAVPRDLLRYFFVYPMKNNRRVIAQSGAFIAAGLLEYKALDKSNFLLFSEIEIPAGAKARIRLELDELNINARALFPEVEHAAKYIKLKWAKASGRD